MNISRFGADLALDFATPLERAVARTTDRLPFATVTAPAAQQIATARFLTRCGYIPVPQFQAIPPWNFCCKTSASLRSR